MRNTFLAGLAALSICATPAADDAPDLGWLQGHWCADADGALIEERWLAPVGATTLGLNRTSRDGRMVAFEFLRIADDEGQLAYLAQPGGRPVTAFPLSEHAEDYVSFENPEHDFPQRIEYRRTGDALSARVSGPGPDGKLTAFDFDFEPCPEGRLKAG